MPEEANRKALATAVTSSDEMADRLVFKQVVVYGASVFRRDSALGRELPDPENDGNPTGELLLATGDKQVAVRYRMRLSDKRVVVEYDAGAVFEKTEAFEASTEAMRGFIADRGLTLLFPYMRQGVADLTQRVGHTLNLGVLNPAHLNIQSTKETAPLSMNVE